MSLTMAEGTKAVGYLKLQKYWQLQYCYDFCEFHKIVGHVDAVNSRIYVFHDSDFKRLAEFALNSKFENVLVVNL